MCTRAHACLYPVHTHAHRRAHACARAHMPSQADSSHGSLLWLRPGCCPSPAGLLYQLTLCPSTLFFTPSLGGGSLSPSTPSSSVCHNTAGQFLVGTPQTCRGPDPIWRDVRPPRRPGDRAANRAPGHREHPHTGALWVVTPEKASRLDSLGQQYVSVRALCGYANQDDAGGGADLVAHLQVQEHIY